LYFFDRLQQHIAACNKEVGRENGYLSFIRNFSPGGRIDSMNLLYFIPKKDDSISKIGITRKNVHRISLYPKGSSYKIQLGATVEYLYQTIQKLISADDFTGTDRQNTPFIFLRISSTINTGYRSHDNNIPATTH